jgi:uncharacterized membrane protein HdeD (DUF308 family)
MTGSLPAAPALARVSHYREWLMAFGVITLLPGVAVLAWPGPAPVVVAVPFGIQLIVTGIFRFVAAFAAGALAGGARLALAGLGALSLIIGFYVVRHVLVTLLALALLTGILWILNGAADVFMALSYREMAGRAWTGLTGVLSIAAGLIVLAYPGISLLALAIVLGVVAARHRGPARGPRDLRRLWPCR